MGLLAFELFHLFSSEDDCRNLGRLAHLFFDKTLSKLGYFGAVDEDLESWSAHDGTQMYAAASRKLPGLN